MSAPAPTFLSVFTGIGGFDLGLERSGWRVLARHWPDVPRWGDVRSVSIRPAELRPDGQSDGHAPGRGDAAPEPLFPRSGLFFEFVRLAGELRPRWILLENVPGLFSSNGGRDFALILHTLDQLGYGVSWRVLDSRCTRCHEDKPLTDYRLDLRWTAPEVNKAKRELTDEQFHALCGDVITWLGQRLLTARAERMP
jgi:hypothetical protein